MIINIAMSSTCPHNLSLIDQLSVQMIIYKENFQQYQYSQKMLTVNKN